MDIDFRYKNVGGEGFDLIRLSYPNMEKIINKLSHKEEEVEFRQDYINGSLWLDDFFDIYFSSIHESFLDDVNSSANGQLLYPAVWKLGKEEFFSFHDCLLFHLLSKFPNKRNNSLKEIQDSELVGGVYITSLSTRGGSYNMKDEERRKYLHNYISQIIKNEEVLSFAISLVDNLIEYKKHNFYHITQDSQKIDDRVKNNVKKLPVCPIDIRVGDQRKAGRGSCHVSVSRRDKGQKLFLLLREYRETLLPYLEGSDLERYFPNNINYTKEEQDKQFDELLNRIIKFKKTSKMVENLVWDNAIANQYIKIFTERNGVFYEIRGVTEASIFNQKTKIIFPILYDFVNSELNERVEKLLNPKLQKVTIIDRDTGKKEILSKPVSVWLDAKEMLKTLAEKFINDKKKLSGIKKSENLSDLLEAVSEAIDGEAKHKASANLGEKFLSYLKKEIESNPHKKVFPKSAKQGNSYERIAKDEYRLSTRKFRFCWDLATKDLPKNSCWKKAGRPKKMSKES